jgi:acyl carrier protein
MPTNSLVAQTLAAEWCAVLGRATPDLDLDFFDAGGTSLSAVALIERVEQRLGIEFPVETLFFDGRLAELISCCEARYGSGTRSVP